MLLNICFGFMMFIVSLIEFSKHVQNEISAKVMPKPQNFTADLGEGLPSSVSPDRLAGCVREISLRNAPITSARVKRRVSGSGDRSEVDRTLDRAGAAQE